ncbi:MAG TPA: hypothetical protein VHV50_08070 [Actinomycetota bacterium]|jgi:hypothetical protein|nr:hypothetical protein [Actinomycetota bacterium]
MFLSVAGTSRNTVLKITAIVGLVALAAGIAAFILMDRGSSPTASGSLNHTPSAAPTLLPQAKWRVRAFPAAVTGKTTKKQLKAARIQGRRASQAIKNVYNALLLDPPAAERVIRAHFEPAAARAFLSARSRLPGRITLVRTTARTVRIGVDALNARKAVATVRVQLKGERKTRRIRLRAQSTLWLERIHHSWRVLAWRARQGPHR